jgi:hypothetical protein
MEYKCKICNKLYSSYQSLWIHNRKFHNINETIKNHNATVCEIKCNQRCQIIQKNHNNSLVCKFCKKDFNHRNNRWRHEKTCKQKENTVTEITELKKEIIELKNLITTKNSNKIINNNTNNNNTNNNINNGTINNNTFIINKIGEESISKLKFKDIKNIFREQKNCLYHAIKYVNFNEKIPENHSFYNSSLEGKYINVFNNDNNEIEKKNKKDFFDSILLSSINITNLLYDKFKDDLSKKKQLKLANMIKEIENIAHLDNNKKLYITNFNEISYNNKKIVKSTWNKKMNDLELSERNESSDEDYDSDSSKDSFYYVTDSD